MNNKGSTNMKELLDRYFQAETNLEEEQLLKDYFQTPEIEAELEQYRSLFITFNLDRKELAPDGFEKKFWSRAEQEKPKVIGMPWSVAAAIALLIAAAWWFYPDPQPMETTHIDWSKYEPDSPEEAYQVLKFALSRTAKELKAGTETAIREFEHVEPLREYFN